jgi:hypothetical protein
MKFSIRDLFLVTVIVALILGWGIDRRQLVEHNRSVQDMWSISVDREGSLLKILDSTTGDLEALERKLDETDPGWRSPPNNEGRGYVVLPGMKIERVPISSAPAPKWPKP